MNASEKKDILTSGLIENIRRNFCSAPEKILTPQAQEQWYPIILRLLDEHISTLQDKG